MLGASYPRATVYDSMRQMLRDYPPHDVRGLGIDPPRDRSRHYRAAVMILWVTVVLPTYALAAVPRETISNTVALWWPLLLVLAIGWQVGMVWLVTRLLALQAIGPAGGASRQP